MKNKLIISLGVVALGIAVILLALPTILHQAGLHPDYTGETVQLAPGKRALIITTSHALLSAPGETGGKPSGVVASELTHPYYKLSMPAWRSTLPALRAVRFRSIHKPCYT